MERIAELVKDGKLDGISDLRDESDRSGMRAVIELKRDAQPMKVLNSLFKHTALATDVRRQYASAGRERHSATGADAPPRAPGVHRSPPGGDHPADAVRVGPRQAPRPCPRGPQDSPRQPRCDHRHDPAHRSTTDTARKNLMSGFALSEIQAQRHPRYAPRPPGGPGAQEDRGRVQRGPQREIARLEAILADQNKILALIREDMTMPQGKYGDVRRTRIQDVSGVSQR